MSHPNQPAHLIACSVFNFPQSVFNFILPAPCHRCSDALCLYKRHVPQLPAVTWPQKCHLGKNRLFSLTFASLKGSGSQGHTVNSVISSQIMKGHCNYFAFSVKMEGETSIDRKLPWPIWPFAVRRKNQPPSDAFQMKDTSSDDDTDFKSEKIHLNKNNKHKYHAIIKF